jgi:hypothetical protein
MEKSFDNENIIKLGNEENPVQVDKTAICRGYLPTYPSAIPDNHPGMTLL